MAKYSRDDLNILQGENLMKIWVVKETVSGKEKNKVFCSNCGCTLWTIPMNHGGEKFIIRTALLNDRYKLLPQSLAAGMTNRIKR